jgi:hypothetical protein
MPEFQPSTNEPNEDCDSVRWLQGAIKERITNVSNEEQREIDALIQRALEPQCGFDRKHARLLYALALVPDHVSWYLKLRERIHRLLHNAGFQHYKVKLR